MGPLSDLRVVELASIGPGPHAMVLGDFEVNDELVYARMTGWGQTGRRSSTADPTICAGMRHPPGEHSREILAELGISDDDIDRVTRMAAAPDAASLPRRQRT